MLTSTFRAGTWYSPMLGEGALSTPDVYTSGLNVLLSTHTSGMCFGVASFSAALLFGQV